MRKPILNNAWYGIEIRLGLRTALGVVSESEQLRLSDIDSQVLSLSRRLAKLRGMSLDEADATLMATLNYSGLRTADEVIEILTNGPRMIGFGQDPVFGNGELNY